MKVDFSSEIKNANHVASSLPVVLVVDDEEGVRYSFRRMMGDQPYEVETFSNGPDSIRRVDQGGVSVVVLDIRLGDEMDGIETLQKIREIDPHVSVVLMTAYASANTAIEATRYGAYDYVLKPFESASMRLLIERAHQAHVAMATAVRFADSEDQAVEKEGDIIIGLSPAMQNVYKMIGRVARSSEPVLISGESGTGKELVARALYQYSNRKDALFLPLNCGAIPETLLESEFFGHERGAFTGAHERRIGKLEQADGGTVFLDEIGEMPLETQVKLLRFLEDRVVTRIGATSGKRVDVRIVTATNRPLEKLVEEGLFRQDLYYRLNVVSVELPPLRKRREDIPLLVNYFIAKHSRRNGVDPPALQPDTMTALERHDWPGNVRELENTIRRVLVQCRGHAIAPDDLQLGDYTTKPPSPSPEGKEGEATEEFLIFRLRRAHEQLKGGGDCSPVLPEIEDLLVRKALDLTGGNQVQAAKILGISRNTLRKKAREMDLLHQKD